MRNRLKERLSAGKVVLGAQMRFGSPAIAELFGRAGFDYVVIDGEHAPQNPVSVQAQLQAIGCTEATPIVRLGMNDPDLIRLYLDMGAMGIVVPFISTAQQARTGARACRYPPKGTRGFGPARAADYGLNTNYFREADDHVLYLPIIETAEAVAKIDDILAVEGVDSFTVGPVDLCISLGIPFELEHPRLMEALKKVATAAHRAGKPAGMGTYGDLTDPNTFKRFIDMGFTLLLGGGDEWLLSAACRNVMSTFAKVRN